MIRRIRRHLGAWGLVTGALLYERGSSMNALFHYATAQRGDEAEPLPEPSILHYVKRMARLTPGANCRHESAAMALWLGWSGRAPEIVAGLRKEDVIEAHAWVECSEIILGNTRDAGYNVFARWAKSAH